MTAVACPACGGTRFSTGPGAPRCIGPRCNPVAFSYAYRGERWQAVKHPPVVAKEKKPSAPRKPRGKSLREAEAYYASRGDTLPWDDKPTGA